MKRWKIIEVSVLLGSICLMCTSCKVSEEEIVTPKDDKVILSVLAGQSTSDAGIEDMIDEALEEKFPKVELQWECVDWGEQFNDLMQSRILAGDVPDIIVGKAQDVHTYAATGNLAKISGNCLDKIDEKALETVTVDEKVYGIPYNAWYQGVIYNKKIFKTYGLNVPKTRDELNQIIEILQESDVTPFACHFRESWKVGNMTMQFMVNDIFRDDSQWGDKFRKGMDGFSNNAMVQKCLKQNQEILKASWPDALLLDQFESDNRFSAGKAAMYLTGSWSMQFTSQYSEHDEFGIFPYPNETGNAWLIRETNMTFMKSSSTNYDEVIDELLEYLLTDAELAEEILDFTQTSSVVKGIEPQVRSPIQDDIAIYETKGQVIDVTIGNSQLNWPFQNDLAFQQLSWLQGEKSFETVLEYADAHRTESKY